MTAMATIVVSHPISMGPRALSPYLLIERTQGTCIIVGLRGTIASLGVHVRYFVVVAIPRKVFIGNGFDFRAIPVALDLLSGARNARLSVRPCHEMESKEQKGKW